MKKVTHLNGFTKKVSVSKKRVARKIKTLTEKDSFFVTDKSKVAYGVVKKEKDKIYYQSIMSHNSKTYSCSPTKTVFVEI